MKVRQPRLGNGEALERCRYSDNNLISGHHECINTLHIASVPKTAETIFCNSLQLDAVLYYLLDLGVG